MTQDSTSSRFGELPGAVLKPLPRIEEELARTLGKLCVPESLRQAMEYATLDGGKRLRPLLVWHGCTAAGGKGPESLPACVAVELVHCFSLVHDDLPALDNDDLRRGRPTLHAKSGEAMAILAGDALLARAFGVLAERLEGEVSREVAGELARACERMIAGQVLDTIGFEGEHLVLPEEQRLETIHRGKTGAMLVASLRMGARCAGAGIPSLARGALSTEMLDRLTAYGHAVGLMFQVVDDLLDVTQSAEHLGKRSSKDTEAGKLTYPGVLGIKRSQELVRELQTTALAELDDLGPTAEPLKLLANYFAVRTK